MSTSGGLACVANWMSQEKVRKGAKSQNLKVTEGHISAQDFTHWKGKNVITSWGKWIWGSNQHYFPWNHMVQESLESQGLSSFKFLGPCIKLLAQVAETYGVYPLIPLSNAWEAP